MNGSVPISTTNSSGPSIGASSLVTDTNSSLSGDAQLQPSTSMNGDSFMRVPASPMSFSSNNTSGSSVIDGSIMQLSPAQEKQRSSSASSQAVIGAGSALHAQKKSRIDASQGDIVQQQLIQQLVHGQNSLHFQGQQNPQLQALIQQHKLAQLQQRQRQQQQQQQQQQHLLQPFSQIQQPQVGIPQQPQLRPPLAQPGIQLGGPVRTPVENAICSSRIKQYLFHKRHHPENNCITYWRKLVEEYFAPRSRERWCVSSYENRGNPSAAAPQKALDSWRCGICNTHGGKGYDATYEVLPRLFQIRFDHGVIDECLFFDSPNEFRLSNGQMVLEYAKVVQKSVYEHLHVIHEGHLRIIFTPELKIMSWEFCSRRHEEYITRKTIAPQISEVVNHMKDLIEFSHNNNLGPKESLNSYSKTIAKFQNMPRQLMAAASLANNQSNTKVMGVQQETSAPVNNQTPSVGAIGNNTLQTATALNSYQNILRSSSANQILLPWEASSICKGPTAIHNGIQLETVRSFHEPGQAQLAQFQHPAPFQQPTPQQNNLHGFGASPQYQQHVFNQLLQEVKKNNNRAFAHPPPPDARRASSGLASGAATPNVATSGEQVLVANPQYQQHVLNQLLQKNNNRAFAQQPPPDAPGASSGLPSGAATPNVAASGEQVLGASPQCQQHVLNQLLQEVKKDNNRAFAQQPPPDAPSASSSLVSGAAAPNVASVEQVQHINNHNSNHNSAVKGAPPAGTGPSNNNNTASIAPSRNNSFKSVSSNPGAAATGGNAVNQKVDESFHELEDLDHLITNELLESGLFGAGQGGDVLSW
ncbi:hypothetical protein PVAP13_4KG054074 [Panicum virgatum]|uniref:Transcriptional regulator SLK2 n=1 Tax=Panicum virgatum TaxID=38727 RepID=A0A8T0THK1_PANVG|nr:hypothetical protein PVAP13_4KG054074 [Panicum virgatum]